MKILVITTIITLEIENGINNTKAVFLFAPIFKIYRIIIRK